MSELMSGVSAPLPPSGVDAVREQQRLANASAVDQFGAFAGHRERTSRLLAARPARGDETLCVLGAGNAYDLDLDLLVERFTEVHLVDLDAEALARARDRTPAGRSSRLFTHAPVDLSGLFHDLERFRRLRVTPDDLVRLPATGARHVEGQLPGPFDVVASTCLLTQLQLSLLRLLGEQHRLFLALRELLSLTHLRALAALTKPGGRAVLVTDLCELGAEHHAEDDLERLMSRLVAAGHVVHSSHPALIEHAVKSDPVLSRAFGAVEQSAPWLWQNGPARRFLVYGLSFERLG